MNKKLIIIVCTVILIALLLSGCAPGNIKYREMRPANFLSGIWHGWIAPFTLIISLFTDSVRLYEPVNTGWWYDFGFYIAILGGFGSLSLIPRKHKDK